MIALLWLYFQVFYEKLPHDKIAAENNIASGTVTSIVNNYKVGLENSQFESVRELAIELRKQGLNLGELALHVRVYNFFRNSGPPTIIRTSQNRSFSLLILLTIWVS
jgi:hypothetical protein